MPLLPVHNTAGKKVEEINLPDTIFNGHINKDVLYQAVVMYHAAQRQGTASTKERGAVSGGGKKPFRQKGTGRARAGSTRSPLWRGGGVVFGPHPREFRYELPQKIRMVALRESLNAKYASEDMLCIDKLDTPSLKTKDFAKILNVLKVNQKTLALFDESDADMRRVSGNIPFFKTLRACDVNAYDVLKNKKLLLTKAALKHLLKRIQ